MKKVDGGLIGASGSFLGGLDVVEAPSFWEDFTTVPLEPLVLADITNTSFRGYIYNIYLFFDLFFMGSNLQIRYNELQVYATKLALIILINHDPG